MSSKLRAGYRKQKTPNNMLIEQKAKDKFSQEKKMCLRISDELALRKALYVKKFSIKQKHVKRSFQTHKEL
jgi:hypothetical protein